MSDMYDIGRAFVALNVVDQATTWYGLRHGGEEGNPVFRRLFASMGFGPATAVKLVLSVALVLLLAELVRRRPALGAPMRWGLCGLCLVYLVVVTWNVLGA